MNWQKWCRMRSKEKETAITAEMERMEKNYKNKIAGYQQQQASMTPEQMEAAGRDVQNLQQQIMEKRQSLSEDFNSFVASKNMSVMKEIKDFLKNIMLTADTLLYFLTSQACFIIKTVLLILPPMC